jgi:hypothetical protein
VELELSHNAKMRKDYYSSKELRSAEVVKQGFDKAIKEAKGLGAKRQ